MHILLTGGTGLMGRALCRYWLTQGHRLTVWSRSPQRVSSLCGAEVRGIGRLEELGEEPLDAVINLAGAPIADRPWTRKRKTLLWASRIGLTEQLLAWLGRREQKPRVLVSGSAVGWYGDGGERELHEDTPQVTDDFAAQLCGAWEETAQRAEALGLRVVLVRTGLVLARDGGMLKRLLLPFKLGLGGRLGSGRQWWSWISLDDEVRAIAFLLDADVSGPVNLTGPEPVRNREYTKALGRAIHRPTVVPIPEFGPKLLLGREMAELLLFTSARVLPTALLEAGFAFRHRTIEECLTAVLGPTEVT